MIDVIVEDTQKYLHLFHWDGSMYYGYILPWLNANNYMLNPNLVELWEWKGWWYYV